MIHDPDRGDLIIARGSRGEIVPATDSRMRIIYDIACELDYLEQARWTHPIILFLKTYRGIEEYATDDDPLPATLQAIRNLRLKNVPVKSGVIADCLCSLGILLYRAERRVIDTEKLVEIWDPMALPFADFIARQQPGTEWVLWRCAIATPGIDVVRNNMLADYVRVNGFT